MTVPLWCLLVACLLPYVWLPVVVNARKEKFGNLDNQHPRLQVTQLEGKGSRAYAAHQNAFEALAVFAPSVLVAHVTHADPQISMILAIVWVVCRFLHGLLYVSNVDKARSGMFAIALLTCIGQFVISAMAHGAMPH